MTTALGKYAIALVAGCLCARVSAAQAWPRCTQTADSVAQVCELDGPVLAAPRSPSPQYPDIFRQAGVGGEVQVEYVVDTTGRGILASLRVLRSTHDVFSAAVRNALPRRRFTVARRQGVGVRARVEEVISFRSASDSLYPRFGIPPAVFEVDSTGLLRITIAAHILADSLEAPRLTEQDRWAIYAAVTEFFIRRELSKPSAFCIGTNGSEPPATILEQWRITDSALVPKSKCPPTYARMVRTPGDPIPPRGYQDPVSLEMKTIKPWARDLVVLEVFKSVSMSRSENVCQVSRRDGRWVDAACYETRGWIH